MANLKENEQLYSQINQLTLSIFEAASKTQHTFLEIFAQKKWAAHLTPNAFGIMWMNSQVCWQAMGKAPEKIIENYLDFWRDHLTLLFNTEEDLDITAISGIELQKETLKRFKDPWWEKSPYFKSLKQGYLLFCHYCKKTVTHLDAVDAQSLAQFEFLMEQFLDAISPVNFVWTNPKAIKAAFDSKGETLFIGYQKWMTSLINGDGIPHIDMVDERAFVLGENIAVTPGKVIFENALMQLIQYSPMTDSVYTTPILFVPPWINKYYILDLQPKDSMVRWLVEKGHTVYLISWVNPDKSHYQTSFEEYARLGVLAAISQIQQLTCAPISAVGFCLGGTLLGCTLAHLAHVKKNPIKSATFLASMLDFSNPGKVGVFIDEAQVDMLEKQMKDSGYLDGKTLKCAFNLLRVNDLYWSFYESQYLLNQPPKAFDLLYWNNDSTHLPYEMYRFYLRNFYLENNLVHGNLELMGHRLDLKKSKVPCYFLATELDHISPWTSVYQGACAIGGSVQFVLGGSGHIAGVINPPHGEKYGYRLAPLDRQFVSDPTMWAQKTQAHSGSWWIHWENWLQNYSGEKIPIQEIHQAKIQYEAAPGRYVKKRIDP